MIIDDSESRYLNLIEEVNIPMINRFDCIYFSFKDLNGNLRVNGDFELQLTIDDVINEWKSETESFSQFSLSQVYNKYKTEVKLDNPLSFKKCYISSISIYTDFQL